MHRMGHGLGIQCRSMLEQSVCRTSRISKVKNDGAPCGEVGRSSDALTFDGGAFRLPREFPRGVGSCGISHGFPGLLHDPSLGGGSAAVNVLVDRPPAVSVMGDAVSPLF